MSTLINISMCRYFDYVIVVQTCNNEKYKYPLNSHYMKMGLYIYIKVE